MLHKRLTCFVFFSILLAANTKAQYDDSSFIRYTVKDGLSDNYVTALQQDDWGYIWIGTDNGLNRFDGYAFKNYYQGTSTLPLPSNTIYKLKSFGNHQLGIISLRGFQVLNTKDFSHTNYFVPDTTAFTTYSNYAIDAALLPDQSFALASATGFYNFNKSGKIIYSHVKYTAADIDKKRILYGRRIIPLDNKNCMVYVDEDGITNYNAEKKVLNEVQPSLFYHPPPEKIGYWIDQFMINRDEFIFIQQREEGIVYYDRLNNRTVISPIPFKLSDEINWFSKITQLDENSFAINSQHRGFFIFHLDRATGKIVLDPKRYLAGYMISCLFVDKDKKLWVGTRKGVLYQKKTSIFIKSYHYPVQSPDKAVPGFSDAYNYKGKLYVSRFSRYNGLVIIDTATMQIEKRIQFYGEDNMWNEVNTMEMFHPDTLWLGTNGGILWFDTRTQRYGKVLDPQQYPSQYFDESYLNEANKDGNAWFCYTLAGIAGRYDIANRKFTFYTSTTQPALPFNKVKSVVTDAYGDTWIGGHALARWNHKKQLFDTLIKVYGGINKYNDDILTLSADDKGSLWLHNTDNGLLEYRINEKKFVAYSMKDGLPSAQIRCMSPVVDDILWIGGVNYLTAFNTVTKKTVVYDYRDGLPEEFPSSRRMRYDAIRNKIYLFCGDYLAEFPAQIPRMPAASPSIHLQELDVNNTRSLFYPKDTVTLPYYENSVSLQFTTINFESPENYHFEYRLNKSGSWSKITGQRNISLNQLQAGAYAITIKVTGKYGEETIKEMTLIINPPFWKTNFFLAVVGLIIAAGIWFIYKNRVRQIRRRANLDKQLAQTEMKALHSQMNPHFIFNSLNSIREMILNDENKDASHYLSKFAQLIRMTLDQSGQTFISLRNTIDYLQRYVDMEKIRNSHFTSSIHVDDRLDVDEVVLPPMIIQPFVENAIWHGKNGNNKNIDIQIGFKKQNNQLVCVIDDDGIGIERSLKSKNQYDHYHNPFGIANVKNRIHLLNEKYNLESSVIIKDKSNMEDAEESGTLVTLYLPLEIIKHE